MRKVLFTVALLLTACFVSAQVSVVKEAKSLKSKPEEAAKAIDKAALYEKDEAVALA